MNAGCHSGILVTCESCSVLTRLTPIAEQTRSSLAPLNSKAPLITHPYRLLTQCWHMMDIVDPFFLWPGLLQLLIMNLLINLLQIPVEHMGIVCVCVSFSEQGVNWRYALLFLVTWCPMSLFRYYRFLYTLQVYYTLYSYYNFLVRDSDLLLVISQSGGLTILRFLGLCRWTGCFLRHGSVKEDLYTSNNP